MTFRALRNAGGPSGKLQIKITSIKKMTASRSSGPCVRSTQRRPAGVKTSGSTVVTCGLSRRCASTRTAAAPKNWMAAHADRHPRMWNRCRIDERDDPRSPVLPSGARGGPQQSEYPVGAASGAEQTSVDGCEGMRRLADLGRILRTCPTCGNGRTGGRQRGFRLGFLEVCGSAGQ